jgi:hypothetical protein
MPGTGEEFNLDPTNIKICKGDSGGGALTQIPDKLLIRMTAGFTCVESTGNYDDEECRLRFILHGRRARQIAARAVGGRKTKLAPRRELRQLQLKTSTMAIRIQLPPGPFLRADSA